MVAPIKKKTQAEQDNEDLMNAAKGATTQAMQSTKDTLNMAFNRASTSKPTPSAVRATPQNTQSTQDMVEGMMGVKKKPTKPGDPLYFENRK